jgi:hypothetical protein
MMGACGMGGLGDRHASRDRLGNSALVSCPVALHNNRTLVTKLNARSPWIPSAYPEVHDTSQLSRWINTPVRVHCDIMYGAVTGNGQYTLGNGDDDAVRVGVTLRVVVGVTEYVGVDVCDAVRVRDAVTVDEAVTEIEEVSEMVPVREDDRLTDDVCDAVTDDDSLIVGVSVDPNEGVTEYVAEGDSDTDGVTVEDGEGVGVTDCTACSVISCNCELSTVVFRQDARMTPSAPTTGDDSSSPDRRHSPKDTNSGGAGPGAVGKTGDTSTTFPSLNIKKIARPAAGALENVMPIATSGTASLLTSPTANNALVYVTFVRDSIHDVTAGS